MLPRVGAILKRSLGVHRTYLQLFKRGKTRERMSEAGFTGWENFQNAAPRGCHPQAKLGGASHIPSIVQEGKDPRENV